MSQLNKACKEYFLVCPYSGCTKKYESKEEIAKIVEVRPCSINNILNKVEKIKGNTKLKRSRNGYCIFDKKPGATISRKVMSGFTPDNEQFIEFDEKFYVSQYGRVKTINRHGNEMFVVQKEKANRLYVRVYLDNDRTKWYTVSRIVAERFVINDDLKNNLFVVHINGNLRNNNCTNLKWVKEKDVAKYKYFNKKAKPILKICPETLIEMDRYTSCAEAARDNFIDRSTISSCIKKEGIGTACGWIWKIDEEFYKGAE